MENDPNYVPTYQPVYQQPVKSELVFENRWSSDLCDCCSDVKICCFACFCWPCFQCCLDNRARECACTQFGISLLTEGSSLGLAILRAKIRGTYKIDGSVIEDCCCATFCGCCVGLQIYRELRYKGEISD